MNKSLAEQLKAINSVMNKPNPIPDWRFTFGQYEGDLLETIVKKDPKYILWCNTAIEEKTLPARVETFISDFSNKYNKRLRNG